MKQQKLAKGSIVPMQRLGEIRNAGLVILGLFPIHHLVWCIMGSSIATHAYSFINSPCIVNTMVCYVLVIHPIILDRVYYLLAKAKNPTKQRIK